VGAATDEPVAYRRAAHVGTGKHLGLVSHSSRSTTKASTVLSVPSAPSWDVTQLNR